jgi:para-aminobenzoate synthetase component 1
MIFDQKNTVSIMDKWGRQSRPFLFVLSYDLEENILLPLEEIPSSPIHFSLHKKQDQKKTALGPLHVQKIPFEKYSKAFQSVKTALQEGNTFLLNLTVSSAIEGPDLKTIYEHVDAPFKLLLEDSFVCFTPERFVKVDAHGLLSTSPMKGTRLADTEGAEESLLQDEKELYEHTTIVDLLRNDISQVADKVHVERFRYLDRIKKADGTELLQMSSEIRGQLPTCWKENLGSWFFKLLPAGSISGAPKTQTLKHIKEAEQDLHLEGKRGYYTGVAGVFDGETLESFVLIRFIEKQADGMVFKSGGGITYRSQCASEYEEIYQKIYLPIA